MKRSPIIILKSCDVWRRAGKANYPAAACSPKTESRGQLSDVEPEVLTTGSRHRRRRRVVACLYVGLCVVHGGPLLLTVFFTVVSAVVRDDVRQATVTFHSIRVTSAADVLSRYAVFTSSIFDFCSTAVRLQFHYGHSTTYVTTGLLHSGLNK